MTAEKIKIPSVLPIKAFTPVSSSARGRELRYSDNLATETGKIIDETKRQVSIRTAEEDGNFLEAATHKQELAKSYLVYLAFRSTELGSPIEQQLWADAFTKESIELYGAPDKSLAGNLARSQARNLLQIGATTTAVDRYKAAARAVGLDVEEIDRSTGMEDAFGFEQSRKAVGEYIRAKYGDVYDAMAIDDHEGLFTPDDIADTFEIGLTQLAENDPRWETWKIDRREDKDSLSVERASRSIIVGMKRASANAEQVTGLFAHEILRHALMAINGKGIDAKLASGLPGYLDFEEGAGVFHEYAMTGKLKDELVDRYTDIALALGYENEGHKISRHALLEYAFAREGLRNSTRGEHEKLSPEDLQKKVYAHVNRIYRGTPGTDEVIGVYTKDIAYLQGFLSVGAYIESELASGKTIEDVMEYITQGKFDPTNPEHVAYVASLHEKKPSRELIVYNANDGDE